MCENIPQDTCGDKRTTPVESVLSLHLYIVLGTKLSWSGLHSKALPAELSYWPHQLTLGLCLPRLPVAVLSCQSPVSKSAAETDSR